jgi:hypothetical protein
MKSAKSNVAQMTMTTVTVPQFILTSRRTQDRAFSAGSTR